MALSSAQGLFKLMLLGTGEQICRDDVLKWQLVWLDIAASLWEMTAGNCIEK